MDPASGLLPNRFEENDGDCSGEIEAARAVHRDCEQILGMGAQECLGQTFGFTAEDEKIAA